MTKRNLILSAAITAALLSAAGAQANGSVSPTSAGVGEVIYAMEGINATALTLPDVVYSMGVGRAIAGQDMVIVYTLPTGVTFNATPVAPTFSAVSSSASPSITFKRGGVGTNEAVYSVSIGSEAMLPADTITLVAPAITSGLHGMTANGSTLSVQVKLLDQVETACVDNAGIPATCFLTSRVAKLAHAATFSTLVADTSTVVDVNLAAPLTGFLVGSGLGSDNTLTQANAELAISNNVANVKKADNTADYTLGATDTVTMTITDPTGFLGRASGTNALFYDLNDDGVADTGENFTISGNTATRTLAGNLADGGTHNVSFTSDGSTAMGTGRTMSMAGSVASTAGIGHALTGGLAAWWTWTSNGTVLETSMFSNVAGYNNRFVFMNYGSTPMTYTATCLVEAGKTAVAGTQAVGTLAVGQTVIPSANVCSITGAATVGGNTAARGAVRFMINAPVSSVKGTYNSVAPNGSFDAIEMLPPRAAAVAVAP